MEMVYKIVLGLKACSSRRLEKTNGICHAREQYKAPSSILGAYGEPRGEAGIIPL
jgi:hypothetical protein